VAVVAAGVIKQMEIPQSGRSKSLNHDVAVLGLLPALRHIQPAEEVIRGAQGAEGRRDEVC